MITETTIYGLIDPITNQLRYIGKSNNIKARYREHLINAKNKKTHRDNWIYSLLIKNKKPELLIIDVIPIEEWKYWELFYINYYLFIGCNLTNCIINISTGLTYGNITSFKPGQNEIPIYQINLNGEIIKEWKSHQQLKNTLKFKISSGLDKIGRTTHGFLFFKKETWDKLSKHEINNIVLCATINKYDKIKNNENVKKTQFKKGEIFNDNRIKVQQIDINTNEVIEIFDSITDAYKKTGASKISLVINGYRSKSGGYKWEKI